MDYSFLPEDLRDIADELHNYLTNEFGINRINIEKPIDDNVNFCPTLSGKTRMGFNICIEVSDSPYPKTLDGFVLDCIGENLPIKLYVAIPSSDTEYSTNSTVEKYEADIRRLKRFGIGLLIVRSARIEEILPPTELSLFLPEYLSSEIPKNFRQLVRDAYQTYRTDPVRGVAALCEEIESIIRKIVKKAQKDGVIPSSTRIRHNHSLNNLIELFQTHHVLEPAIIGKCFTFVEIRNDKSHPPKTYTRRRTRQKKLKENFLWVKQFLLDVNKLNY